MVRSSDPSRSCKHRRGHEFGRAHFQQSSQPLRYLLLVPGYRHGVHHPRAPHALGYFRKPRAVEHVPVEGRPGKTPELFRDGCPGLLGVVVDAHRHMGYERRREATGLPGPALHGRKGNIPQVGAWTYPADRAVGFGPAHLERALPKGGGHHRHVNRGGNTDVGLVIAPGVVH